MARIISINDMWGAHFRGTHDIYFNQITHIQQTNIKLSSP